MLIFHPYFILIILVNLMKVTERLTNLRVVVHRVISFFVFARQIARGANFCSPQICLPFETLFTATGIFLPGLDLSRVKSCCWLKFSLLRLANRFKTNPKPDKVNQNFFTSSEICVGLASKLIFVKVNNLLIRFKASAHKVALRPSYLKLVSLF